MSLKKRPEQTKLKQK